MADITGSYITGSYAEVAKAPRAIPESPQSLGELASRATNYAEAASRFIDARDDLTAAREAFQTALDRVHKTREVENV